MGFYNSVCNTCVYSVPADLFEESNATQERESGRRGSITSYNGDIIARPQPAGPSIKATQELVWKTLATILPENRNGALSPLVQSLTDIYGKEPKWVWLKTIDLRDVVRVTQNLKIEEILESGHAVHMMGNDGTQPLWRVAVNIRPPLKGGGADEEKVQLDVAFFFNHAIGDGFSGLAFHADLRDALNARVKRIAKGDMILPEVEDPVPDPIIPVDEYPHTLIKTLEEAIHLKVTPSGYWNLIKSSLKPVKGVWTGPVITAPCPSPDDCSSSTSSTHSDSHTHGHLHHHNHHHTSPSQYSPTKEPTTAMTKVRVLTLPARALSNIKEQCRENRTTITAYITYVIADALATQKNQLQDNSPAGTQIDSLVASIAISFRRKAGMLPMPGRPTLMVAYTSSYSHIFPLQGNRLVAPPPEAVKRKNAKKQKQTRPGIRKLSEAGRSKVSIKDWARERGIEIDWDEVRRIKSGLTACSNSTKNQLVSFLKVVGDYRKYILNKVGKARSESFEVSNLGVIDVNQIHRPARVRRSEGVKVEKLVLSQSAGVSGPPLAFGVATLKGGDMTLTLTWQEGLGLDMLAERVGREVGCRLGINGAS